MPGRRWSDGQHQAMRPRNHYRSSRKLRPSPRSPPELFLLYRLAGTMILPKLKRWVEKTYKLKTTIVPTNRLRARQDWADQVYKTETSKWRAVANETAEIHKNGRPVLVGTTSVEKSELLGSCSRSRRFPQPSQRQAENVERESEIVAQAGRAGAVTIATNMASRGPTSSLVATAITWPA